MQNITVTIERKGRKWFKVSTPETSLAQLLIDNNTENFEIGSTYSFAAELEDNREKKYGKLNITYAGNLLTEKENEDNKKAALIKEKDEALENYTDFVSRYHIGYRGNCGTYLYYQSRTLYNVLKRELDKYKDILTKEDNDKIKEALNEGLESVRKRSEYIDAMNERESIRQERVLNNPYIDIKKKLIRVLNATGNESIADIVYNLNPFSHDDQYLIDDYASKYIKE